MYKRSRSQGVITVLVSLMLVGILSMGNLVIEAGRYQSSRTQLSEANISAATSMIAAYDSDLYSRYGLLAIDTERFTNERVTDYVTFNSDQASGYAGINNFSKLYNISSVEAESLYNLTYPAVLKRQILSRAKYHIIPQDYALNYYNIDSFMLDYLNKAEYIANILSAVANGSANVGTNADIPAEMAEALNAMKLNAASALRFEKSFYDKDYGVVLNGASVSALPSKTGTVASNVPAEDKAAINDAISDAQSVLGANGAMLAGNGTGYTETDISFNTNNAAQMLIKYLNAKDKDLATDVRKLAQNINSSLKVLNQADKEGNLLLNSYITDFFSNRNYIAGGYSGPSKGTTGAMNNATFVGACAEYVFAGNADEAKNQQEAAKYIFAVRFINNLYITLTESASFNANNARNAAAHIIWAWCETAIDLGLLTKYNADVPMNKIKMILPVNEPAKVVVAFSSSNDFAKQMQALGIFDGTKFTVAGTDKMSYNDALAISLWLVPNSTKLMRIADLIQLEMRYKEQYVDKKAATFLMSEQDTYCRVKCVARFNPGLPIVSLGTNNNANGTEIISIKYAGY